MKDARGVPSSAGHSGCHKTFYGAPELLRGGIQHGILRCRLCGWRVKGVYRGIWIWDNSPHRSAMWMHTKRPLLPGAFALTLLLVALGSWVQAARAQNPRGTPYIQVDLRISRPFNFHERFTATPFIEFFNLFNRNNPGANYVTNVEALPDLNQICSNPPVCSQVAVNNVNQLRFPAGALGDFFGPGTTVGVPFAAQMGGDLRFEVDAYFKA
jgi:hypothetical protein